MATHEAQGGHLLIKHVGRTDAQLAERLQAEPHLPAASTFSDRARAEAAVSEALRVNAQNVQDFLNSKKGKTTITHNLNQPVGVSLLNRATHPQPTQKLLLVLKKTLHSLWDTFC